MVKWNVTSFLFSGKSFQHHNFLKRRSVPESYQKAANEIIAINAEELLEILRKRRSDV